VGLMIEVSYGPKHRHDLQLTAVNAVQMHGYADPEPEVCLRMLCSACWRRMDGVWLNFQ
jgi:hypothetical protein